MSIVVIDASLNLHRVKNVLLANARNDTSKVDEILNVNSFARIFFRMLPTTLDHFDATRCYLLWDQGRCMYRVALNEQYKVARNEVKKDELSEKANSVFFDAREYLHEQFPQIGVSSILVPGVEADDIAYYLSHTQPSGVLVSDDQDWFLNMNANWKLYRTMQKTDSKFSFVNGQNLFDWDDFTKLMKGDNIHSLSDPRHIYLYEKALVGDKDEIPRVTTKAPALRIAKYLSGLTDQILPKDQLILDVSKDLIENNLKLADTNWLIKDPTIIDMKNVLDNAHKCVHHNSMENFFDFAIQNNCLLYQEKWNKNTRLLNY